MARPSSPTPSSSSSSDGGLASFMEEPTSFRPVTPPPTVATYVRRKYGGVGVVSGAEEVQVGLVSGHPLWGHILYPAAIAMSCFLELHAETLLRGTTPGGEGKGKAKNVLELGAGGGLPGLVAALEGAAHVVISDFPDASLVNNLAKNVEINIGELAGKQGVAVTRAAGFTWGSPPTHLLESLPAGERFDLILLSDLVFNHSQHAALLDSCLACLTASTRPSASSSETPTLSTGPEFPSIDLSSANLATPVVLCFYSHHRPTAELIAADLGLLSLARAKGWTVTRVWKDDNAGPAFPEDAGDIYIRGTVHGWALTRA